MTDQELLDYLLGELSEPEAVALEQRLAADPQLRERIERMRPMVATLDALPADAWRLPEPPPLAAPAPAPARRVRVLRLRPLVAAACAVALLLVGGVVGGLIARDGGSASGQEVRLEPLGNAPANAQGTVRIAPDDGDGARLTVTGLKPLGDDDFYELWLLGKGGELIGLGSFRVDPSGAATVTVPVPVDPGAFQYFDVSLEPSDGDPGHSGDSVLRAPTTS